MNCKEIQSVNPQGNQSWIFIGRTDAAAKTPILWPPDVKHQFIGKDPHAGKDWRQDEMGMTGWDSRMASPTRWMSLSNSGSWWWTEKTGVLQPMGSQRVRHDWETELNWTMPKTPVWDDCMIYTFKCLFNNLVCSLPCKDCGTYAPVYYIWDYVLRILFLKICKFPLINI